MTALARPWLKSYPDAVAPEIELSALKPLPDILVDALKRYGSKPAFESFGKRQTFAETLKTANAVASWLQQQGCKRGERIALMMPNIMAYPSSIFGVLIGGFTVVNVNPLYTPRELEHQLKDSGATTLFVMENFAHVAEEALPHTNVKRVVIVKPGNLLGAKGAIINFVSKHVKKAVKPWSIPGAIPFAAVISGGAGKAPAPHGTTLDDVAFLQYTGGTTGVSKGATLLHRNVAANLAQCEAWLAPSLSRDRDHVMVTALPLYHIFGLTCCCMLMARLGAMCLLIANPRDFDGFVGILKKSRATMFSGVNTLYNALINHPEIKQVDFSQVELSVAGGMAVQSAVARNWQQLTGRVIVEGYGLSETSPVATLNRTDLKEFSGHIGYPAPSTDIVIRDETGKDMPLGEPGELCIRGPQVMAGYWQRDDETAKVMTADGFFRSGDIAVQLPDGAFKIVDRLKDMILVSGFNVYPNEVEDVIASHPGVLEVAVIGLPDPTSGEAVAAYVVKKDKAMTEESLRAHCKENLTGYKNPRHIIFRDALPKTNVGKVLRRTLRDEAKAAG